MNLSKFKLFFSDLKLKIKSGLAKFSVSRFLRRYFFKAWLAFYSSKWRGLLLIGMLLLAMGTNYLFVFDKRPEAKAPFGSKKTFRQSFFHPLGSALGPAWLDGNRGAYSQKKKTLQVWEGPLIEYGIDHIRILKIKQGQKLKLEFSHRQMDGSYRLINSVPLQGIYEGLYSYLDSKNNKEGLISLAVFDHNGDGKSEVIAPSFDRFFRPHVNVAGYNEQTGKFYLKPTSPLPKINKRF